jgi:hypothetical protein
MTTITVPVDTLIHTQEHPTCSDATCPCQGDQAASAFDLTGYQFAPRTIRHRGRGQDIQIGETPWKYGLRCRITIAGVTLTRVQAEELARAAMLWKYGVRPAVSPSPFAQALGLDEYEHM